MNDKLDYPIMIGKYNDNYNIYIYKNNGKISLSSKTPEPELKIDFSEAYTKNEENFKRLSFRLTGSCNMGCEYCFTNFHSMRSKLEKEKYRQAIDNFVNQLEDNDEAGIIITGGEATLYKNDIYNILKYSTEKCRKRKINCKYLIYSNYTLIDEKFLEKISGYNVSIALSIDGEQEEHDRNRYNPAKKSSYKIILENLLMTREKFKNINLEVRTVIQPEEDNIVRIINNNLSLGFTRMHLMPVYGFQSEQYKGSLKAWQEALNVYEKIILNGYRIEIEPFYSMYRKIRYPHTFLTSFYPCNAGRTNLCVGDDGNYYLCNHFVGNKDEILSNVELGIPGKEKLLKYITNHSNNDVCSNCSMFRLCGGACYHKVQLDKAPHNFDECKNWIEIIKMIIKSYIKIMQINPSALKMLCDTPVGNKTLDYDFIRKNIISQLDNMKNKGVE